MKKLQFVLFLIVSFGTAAQSDSVNYQQLYLHLNKQAFIAGDTIWYKAYVVSDFYPDAHSKNLFIDLLDENGKLISAQKLPILTGISWGNIALPLMLAEGWYVIRAYTTQQLGGGTESLFYEPVAVFNPQLKQKRIEATPATQPVSTIELTMQDHEKGKRYLIKAHNSFPSEKIILEGYMYGEQVFKQNIKLYSTEISGIIPSKDLPTGLLQLKLYDGNKNMIAQTAGLINHHDFFLPVDFHADTFSTGAKAKNVFAFQFPDSISGSFSVSITDYDREIPTTTSRNIFSDLLMHPYSSWINIPASDLLSDGISTKANALMTSKTLPSLMRPEVSVPEQDYIEIRGKATIGNKPYKKGDLNFMVKTRDSTTSFTMASVQQDGSFTLSNLIFEDTATIFLEIGKKTPPEIFIDTNSKLKLPAAGLPASIKAELDQSIFSENSGKSIAARLYATNADTSMNGYMNEVFIITKKQSPTILLNKKYTTGIFGNMSMVKLYDLVNEPPATFSGNLFDWLQGRVAGLTIIRRSGLQYELRTNRSPSLTGAPAGVQLYLNESQQYTTDNIASIPLSQIALVKYFYPGYHSFPGAMLAPVLAVYTKQPEDIGVDQKKYLRAFTYPGYSVNNEFYAPDYSLPSSANDRRTTLYWNPDISVEGKSFSVLFYNSDRAKSFHIVVEGFTSEGKLVHFEKILQ
jgi:hypothetical protein